MTTAEFFKRTVIVLCVALVPLAVIAFIAIEKLYVRDSLGEATALPGEPKRRGERMAG